MKRIGPYRLFFVSSDFHEPPHIHVQREKMVAKFWLDPVSLAKNRGFSLVELNHMAKMVEENRLNGMNFSESPRAKNRNQRRSSCGGTSRWTYFNGSPDMVSRLWHATPEERKHYELL